jgi:hypothetical protein
VNTPTDVGGTDDALVVELELPQPDAASSANSRIARFINVSFSQNQSGIPSVYFFGLASTSRSSILAPALACLAALCLPASAWAQAHVHPAGDSRERYSVSAVRVDQAPKIDGVLDDAAAAC